MHELTSNPDGAIFVSGQSYPTNPKLLFDLAVEFEKQAFSGTLVNPLEAYNRAQELLDFAIFYDPV
jgi:hypothetical protein